MVLTTRAISATLLVAVVIAQPSLPPCSLNGQLTNGSCVCLPGWTGETCRTLDLLPAAPLSAENQTYFHPSDIPAPAWHDNSWGISVALDDDGVTLHGFMTELEGNCSLSEYGQASQILHVTSAGSPAGPWTVQGVALREFAHNPNIVRDVDGAWLLFHIGYDFGPYCAMSCASGKPVRNASCQTNSTHASSVARATSPYGPWERVFDIFPNHETNPSAYVFPNGTIFATARRWTAGIPVYTAQSWRGPYTQLAPLPLYTVPTPTPAPAAAASSPFPSPSPVPPVVFEEDPFLYRDALGGFHMLTHRQPHGTSCSATGPTSDDCRCAGGHLYAETAWGPWWFDPVEIFNCTLAVAGNASSMQLHARQRPTLFTPPAPPAAAADPAATAATACSPVLFTGASTDPVSQYYSSFTMAQRTAGSC